MINTLVHYRKEKKMRVAINGFGRIGRLSFRAMFEKEGIEIIAINATMESKMIAHLLKYDSIQGRYCDNHDITYDDTSLTVDGKTIKIYRERDPKALPWGDDGIDVVLECTGAFTSKEKSQAHLEAGAKKVLISAPAGNDVPTIVYGTNHETLKAEDLIVSGASCTTNCLAPMTKALHDYKEIVTGLMTTIHAYTSDQMILDGHHKKGDLRRSRAGAENIVPASSGAAKAIGLVIPELAGKLTGSAQRVPVPTGSITILDAVVKSDAPVTVDGINEAMKAAADESFGYTEEELVSSDIVGMPYGSLFDATQTSVMDAFEEGMYLVRIVAWYDNEMSYVNQLIRTLQYMGKL